MNYVISDAVHMNSVVFSFLFLRGVGSHHRALVTVGWASPASSLLEESGKMGKAIAQETKE